jgi:integrase
MPSAMARQPGACEAGAVAEVIARLAALTDSAFLAQAGWDPGDRVLSLPSGHPLLGWRECPVPGCGNALYGRDRECGQCRRGAAGSLAVLARDDLPRERGDGMRVIPASADKLCQVAACGREQVARRYCRPHYRRMLGLRSDPSFGESGWWATEPAIERPGQVSLHGVSPQAAAEVLYGLQQRTRYGAATSPAQLRQVAWELRRTGAASIGEIAGGDRVQHRLVRCLAKHAASALSTPEAEIRKDVWGLAVFGLPGRLVFTAIRQPWLRETAKRWAADDLPRRRGKIAADPVRHYLTSLAALSDSLHAARAGHGTDPALLGRADIESFVHRMTFLANEDRISADYRTRACREIRHLLRQFRALGLTRAAGPAAGLPDDFAVRDGDIPLKPDEPEAGRDLPPEIMRQLCGHLPALEDVSCREARVAAELLIDTGRRPDEICALPWDCLEYDEPGHEPVLVYFNHKSARQGRRLPIAQATAELITAQKARIRETFPGTELSQLKLLPAPYANPNGRRSFSVVVFGARHREWITSLPPLQRADGTEFDKARVVPYACRHTYAQRHADAGVPVDVLAELMDHRSLDTTRGYYTVGDRRRRDAVDKVAALQFDRNGNRIWRDARTLLDSEHARRAIGEVAVPYGTCSEPSNVQAGGNACPCRFRCAGCDHFRTDVSYLPDLTAYLDDLLRTRERLAAAIDGVDEWARADATPAEEEITRIRRLIARIHGDIAQLPAAERAQVDQAVTVIRKHRAVNLGMPALPPSPAARAHR